MMRIRQESLFVFYILSVHCILLDCIGSFRVYGEAFSEVVEKEGFYSVCSPYTHRFFSRIRHLRLGSFRVVSAYGKNVLRIWRQVLVK